VKEEEKREEVIASPKKKQDLKLCHFVGEIIIAPKVIFFLYHRV